MKRKTSGMMPSEGRREGDDPIKKKALQAFNEKEAKKREVAEKAREMVERKNAAVTKIKMLEEAKEKEIRALQEFSKTSEKLKNKFPGEMKKGAIAKEGDENTFYTGSIRKNGKSKMAFISINKD